MVNYDDGSKSFGTKVYPISCWESSNLLGRVESIIGPDQVMSRYLKGIDVSDFNDAELKDQINLAISDIELLSNLCIMKQQIKERQPFDRALYKSFVYTKLTQGPILSIDHMSIESSNGENIYNLPSTWIEVGHALTKRQINLIPILSIFGAAGLQDGQPSNAGLIFLRAINNYTWLPSFFSITYTVGMSQEEGKLPTVMNDIIGMTTAIRILNLKQMQNKYNSTSISQDGISQSASTGGPQVYQNIINNLTVDRDKLLSKFKAKFAQKYFLSNI